jgi:hypothetical protein
MVAVTNRKSHGLGVGIGVAAQNVVLEYRLRSKAEIGILIDLQYSINR